MELLDLARGKYKYVNVNTRQTNQKKNLKIQDDIKIFFTICDLKLQKKIFFSSNVVLTTQPQTQKI